MNENTTPIEEITTNDSTILTDDNINDLKKSLGDYAKENPKIVAIRNVLRDTEPEIEEALEGYDDEKNYIPDDHSDELDFEDLSVGKGVDLINAAITKMESGDDAEGIEKLRNMFSEAMPIDEVRQMLQLLKRYRAGEKFSAFKELPPSMKDRVKQEFAANGRSILDKESLNLFSNLLIEQFNTEVLELASDREIIDFNKSLEETLKQAPNVVSMYGNYIRTAMENDLLVKAEEIEAEHPAGAAIYRACSKAFTDSYTYTYQYNELKKGKVRSRLLKDNDFYNKYVRDINIKNERNRFAMEDMNTLYSTLDAINDNIFDGMLKDSDIKSFVILTCKAFRLLDGNDTASAMLMYYTVFNIHNLSIYLKEEENEFNETIIINIKKLFNTIWEAENDERRFEIKEFVPKVIEEEPSEEEDIPESDFKEVPSSGVDDEVKERLESFKQSSLAKQAEEIASILKGEM